ncbi:DUF86 domain-containing protein [candidate division KSB1 bacterium]|nr:DUF86 domain-containing protein [candidate division KSB1 bacterium]
MRLEKDINAYLWDMLNSAQEICQFTKNVTFNEYMRDRKLQLALERALEIIGKAARHIPEIYQQAHPEIPWRKIIAQRHVVAHEYGELKKDRLWVVITEHIPDLVLQLEKLMPPMPPEL